MGISMSNSNAPDLLEMLPPRSDVDAAKDRLRTWWDGEPLGRPALDLTADRPASGRSELDTPEGWLTDYSVSDIGYRYELSVAQVSNRLYFGEAFPLVKPDLGPSSLAGVLGSEIKDSAGNVWIEPCLESDEPDPARIALDHNNRYWRFTCDLLERQLLIAPGIVHVGFPDLGEGLDVLAAMRGTQTLLLDFYDRPEWIVSCLERIDRVHDEVYRGIAMQIQDSAGGVHHWMWSPGNTGRFQCDASAMLSPDLFAKSELPDLVRLCDRHSHSIYHWDGTDALVHEEALLSVEKLDVVQWVPGAGQPMVHDSKWWPLYERILAAGKKVALVGLESIDMLERMREHFGPAMNRFFLRMHAEEPETASRVLEALRV